ncbi:MAG: Rieske (2Fe-2S) protein, partial [Actinomycetota bacterium]
MMTPEVEEASADSGPFEPESARSSGMSQAVERAEQRTLRSDELAPGTLREVRVEGRRVMLARLRSGEVVATGAACPHEAAPLA